MNAPLQPRQPVSKPLVVVLTVLVLIAVAVAWAAVVGAGALVIWALGGEG